MGHSFPWHTDSENELPSCSQFLRPARWRVCVSVRRKIMFILGGDSPSVVQSRACHRRRCVCAHASCVAASPQLPALVCWLDTAAVVPSFTAVFGLLLKALPCRIDQYHIACVRGTSRVQNVREKASQTLLRDILSKPDTNDECFHLWMGIPTSGFQARSCCMEYMTDVTAAAFSFRST